MDAIFLTDNGDTSHFFNTEKYAPSTSFNLTPLSQPLPTTKYLGRKNRLKAEGWRLEGEPCEMITKTSAFNRFVSRANLKSENLTLLAPCPLPPALCSINLFIAFSLFASSSTNATGLPLTMAEFTILIFLKSSIARLNFFAISSMHGRLFTSVAVVMTGFAPIILAILFARLLAPPKCPERRLITYLPFSSITTTAGSSALFFKKGAMLLTTMPLAMMNTRPSDFPNACPTWFLKSFKKADGLVFIM